MSRAAQWYVTTEHHDLKSASHRASANLRPLALLYAPLQQPSSYPSLQPFLENSLRTLSLTLPRSALSSHADFYQELNGLVSNLRLIEEFTLYAPGGVQADEEPASGEDELMYAGREAFADLPWPEANGERSDPVFSDTAESGSLHAYTPLPKYVPRLPLSLLRALLQHRLMAAEAAQLKLLRIHGIVCSIQGLELIGQVGHGLQDLTLQLEYTPIVSETGRTKAALRLDVC